MKNSKATPFFSLNNRKIGGDKDAGSYAVLYYLNKDQEIQISKLGRFLFKRGYYAYSGSAKKNLKKRVLRHIRKDKKKFKWHIDFFVNNICTGVKNVYVFQFKTECQINKFFLKKGGETVVKKFGSSDCRKRCKSHFLYFGDKFEIDKPDIKRFGGINGKLPVL